MVKAKRPRKAPEPRTDSRTERLTAAVSVEDAELARWYARTVDREISKLLRYFSVEGLLAAARRLQKLNLDAATASQRMRLLAQETVRLAELMEDTE